MTKNLTIINMSELSDSQFTALRNLTVSEHQEVLGKSFKESIDDWESMSHDQVLGLCFMLEEQPVGLTLFNKREASTASIHGLKIATPWQRNGLGHTAFRLAVDYLKTAWPDVELLKLAVDAENAPAVKIYIAAGMSDSGPIFQGPNGLSHRMELQLNT